MVVEQQQTSPTEQPPVAAASTAEQSTAGESLVEEVEVVVVSSSKLCVSHPVLIASNLCCMQSFCPESFEDDLVIEEEEIKPQKVNHNRKPVKSNEATAS